MRISGLPAQWIASLSHWLGRTLARKFILLLLGFLVLQILQLAIGAYGIPHIGEEGAYLNQTGRMRMQTLLANHYLHKTAEAGVWGPNDRAAFEKGISEMDAFFQLPSVVKTQDEEYAEFNRLMEEARRVWQQTLRPLLSGFDPARRRDAVERYRRYEAAVPAEVARFERMASLLEEDVREDSRLLTVFQILILGASILFGVTALMLARSIVSRPLRELIAAARKITAGAYDRRLTVSSRDEIGVMAATFNEMAGAIDLHSRRLEALTQAAGALTSTLSLHETLDRIMYHGIGVIGARAACIAFYDMQKQQFTDTCAQGLSGEFLRDLSFSPGGLADRVFQSGRLIAGSNRPGAEHGLSERERAEGIRAFVCLPMLATNNRLGVICFYIADRDECTPEDLSLAATFAHLAANAANNSRLYDLVQEESRTDVLTGLLNRREFDRRLNDEHNRAQRYQKPYAIAMLDIDHFKRINDHYGHQSGDDILHQIGGILGRQFRDVDVVARYGGEEFIVLLPEIGGGTAKGVVERVRRVIAGTSFQLSDKREIGVTISAGISCYPNCAATSALVVSTADQALFVAKETGRNRTLLYRETLKARIEKDPGLISQLLAESLDNVKPVVTAISAKAPFLRPHCEQVWTAAMAMARAMKLGHAEIETLRLAALLHDVGMLSVPDSVISRTSPLSPEDWGAIKDHPVTGSNWLAEVPALTEVAAIVRSHHERYDGKGYPDGLPAAEMPFLARVLAVADAYGAMVSDWPGHRAMSAAEAIDRLKAGAGTQFDPEMVELLLKALADNVH